MINTSETKQQEPIINSPQTSIVMKNTPDKVGSTSRYRSILQFSLTVPGSSPAKESMGKVDYTRKLTARHDDHSQATVHESKTTKSITKVETTEASQVSNLVQTPEVVSVKPGSVFNQGSNLVQTPKVVPVKPDSVFNQDASRVAQLQHRGAVLDIQIKRLCQEMEHSKQAFERTKARLTTCILDLKAEMRDVINEIQSIHNANITEVYNPQTGRALDLKDGCTQSRGSRLVKKSTLVEIKLKNGGAKGRLRIQKTSVGAIVFGDLSPDGGLLVLTNTSDGRSGAAQALDGWQIKRVLDDGKYLEYVFGEYTLGRGKSVKIISARATGKLRGRDNCLKATFSSWGSGGSKTYLYDRHGAEKASILHKLSPN